MMKLRYAKASPFVRKVIVFADEAGIHRTYASDIERGATNPTIAVVEKLAKPLGVPASRPIE